MKSIQALGLAILWMGAATLILILTNPVDRVLSFTCAIWGIIFFVVSQVLYRKERKKLASVYSDWDKGFDRATTTAHDYFSGELFEKGVIIEYRACPRCAAPTWRKVGLPYADPIGNMCQLWKCFRCKYEEQRFA